MAQTLSHPIALDYDSTLVLAIELSNTSWVLAAQVPGLPRVKAKQSIEPTAGALLAAVDRYRDRARAAGKTVQRVVATYEASWSGFWLARWLLQRGVETYVVQPSSVPVDRRARRAKNLTGSTLSCCCARCWPGFGANRVCAQWCQFPTKSMRMSAGASGNGKTWWLSG